MANTSILAAFERMWQHIVVALSNKAESRTSSSLVPYGTEITNNSDLNSIEFIKVGNYRCPSNAGASSLLNCPTNGTAFMMKVYVPLSTNIDDETTASYIYRVRKITTYMGDEYIQEIYNGSNIGIFTYGKWKHIMKNVLSSEEYGTTLPAAGTAGRIFFKKV